MAPMVALAFVIGLALLLAVAGRRLDDHISVSARSLGILQQILPRMSAAGSANCLGRDEVFSLLRQVSHIESPGRGMTALLSRIDGRVASRQAARVTQTTVREVLVPTLSCRLSATSRALLIKYSSTASSAADGFSTKRLLFEHLTAEIRALQENLARFDAIDQNEKWGGLQSADKIERLSVYVFNSELPAGGHRWHGMLGDALRRSGSPSLLDLPPDLQTQMASLILAKGRDLRSALDREISAGPELLESLGRRQEPVAGNARHLVHWLTWVNQSWSGATRERNPCRDIARSSKPAIDLLIENPLYGSRLTSLLASFGDEQCRAPAIDKLAGMRVAPHGSLFLTNGDSLEIAPAWREELAGAPALMKLPFMHLDPVDPFQCLSGAEAWNIAELAEARTYLEQYRTYITAQKRSPTPSEADPLYMKLARWSLESTLDDSLRRAQKAALPRPASMQASPSPDPDESQISVTSRNMLQAQPLLQSLLEAYKMFGRPSTRRIIRQCVRDFAADHLRRIDALVARAGLYEPTPSDDGERPFLHLQPSENETYLRRELARTQVLVSDADPFASILSNAMGEDETGLELSRTTEFWRNSAKEISGYLHADSRSGQVAILNDYFTDQVADMTRANCATASATYRPPPFGNDLFSIRRQSLARSIRQWCAEER